MIASIYEERGGAISYLASAKVESRHATFKSHKVWDVTHFTIVEKVGDLAALCPLPDKTRLRMFPGEPLTLHFEEGIQIARSSVHNGNDKAVTRGR